MTDNEADSVVAQLPQRGARLPREVDVVDGERVVRLDRVYVFNLESGIRECGLRRGNGGLRHPRLLYPREPDSEQTHDPSVLAQLPGALLARYDQARRPVRRVRLVTVGDHPVRGDRPELREAFPRRRKHARVFLDDGRFLTPFRDLDRDHVAPLELAAVLEGLLVLLVAQGRNLVELLASNLGLRSDVLAGGVHCRAGPGISGEAVEYPVLYLRRAARTGGRRVCD